MENNNFTTSFNKIVTKITETIDKSSEEYKHLSAYLNAQRERFEKEFNDETKPFLTIITRTQGKRIDMLIEMLLCLTGQSDTDFELLLMGHNLSEEQQGNVQEILEDLPAWMKERTRFIPISGGTRTTPLIKGFQEARGKYAAVLDDDDIVFDNWVESFKKTAMENPGLVIHSYVLHQDWETVNSQMPNVPISMDAPTDEFCKDFDMLNELTLNSCPLLGLAFPLYSFKVLNICFDEELTTTEDWDFFMRTSFISGVADSKNATSVYRRWLNAESSQTVHSQEEWTKNFEKIVERFKKQNVILQGKSLEEYIDTYLDGSFVNRNCVNVEMDKVELFYDNGKGYSSGRILSPSASEDANWIGEFNNLDKLGGIRSIRLDPRSRGNIVLHALKIRVNFVGGKFKDYEAKNVRSNGYYKKKSIAFIKNDPQMIIPFRGEKNIQSIQFYFRIQAPIPDYVIDSLIGKKLDIRALLGKIKRAIKRCL